MITARPGTPLHYWCTLVSSLKPGEAIDLCLYELRRDIDSYQHNGVWFYPPDRILGNIVGSAYTHSYIERPGASVTFYRHEDTGEIRHRDPDRR